jgi:hypothetical protein
MTWDELTKIEPRLLILYHKALRCQGEAGKDFCANTTWYGPGGLKSELYHLVGFEAEKPEAATSKAYDVAYQKIYNALPDCSHDELFCCGG